MQDNERDVDKRDKQRMDLERLKVHTEKSRLYHTDVIERAVLTGLLARLMWKTGLSLASASDVQRHRATPSVLHEPAAPAERG